MAEQLLETKYAGADWLKKITVLSEFGAEVADVLGEAYRGIYHIQSAVTHKRCDWSSDSHIEVVVGGEMATFDNSLLTRLLLLCHDRAIRLSITGASTGYLRLWFHRRKPVANGVSLRMWERHPSIEQQIEAMQKEGCLKVKEVAIA